jgi:hypothetical protein
MLPDIGEWKTVREADNWGGPVLMRRDHDRISMSTASVPFFDAAQFARFTAAGEEILAEGRQWLAERCKCGIGGSPATVMPYACPVHGVACDSCGGVEECGENCDGE